MKSKISYLGLEMRVASFKREQVETEMNENLSQFVVKLREGGVRWEFAIFYLFKGSTNLDRIDKMYGQIRCDENFRFWWVFECGKVKENDGRKKTKNNSQF